MSAETQIPLGPAAGRDFVTLTGWTGSALFTATPVAGEQIEGPDTLTYPADSDPIGADGTYTLRHIKLSGEVEAVEYQIGEPAVEPSSASTTVPLVVPEGLALATLQEGFDPHNFQQQPVGEPQAGWQLVNDAAYGYFDSQGNFWVYPGDLEGEFDLWFIDLDGVVYKETMRTSDLANVDGSTGAPGNSQAWIFNKFIKPLAAATWTWGRRHPKTGMRVRVHK